MTEPTGPVANEITAKLQAAFSPERLEVIDDSWKHAGHSGAKPEGETHFTVKLTSPAFAGLSRLDRQRRVNEVLADELARERVHALSIQASAPGEE